MPEPDTALGACELLDASGEEELGAGALGDGELGDGELGEGAVSEDADGTDDVSDTGAEFVAGEVSELVSELVGVVAVDGERGAGVATPGA